MFRSNSSQHKTPGTGRFDTYPRKEQSKAYAPPNWANNVIKKDYPSQNSQKQSFSYQQPHSVFENYHNRNLNAALNTARFYKLITSEGALWANITRSLDAITKPSTQNILEFIQRQATAYRSGTVCDISLLDHYLYYLPDKEKQVLQTQVFPEMTKLVLKTPTLFPKDLAMLPQGCSEARVLTREQCACLLAHMFMCTTLRQSSSLLPMRHNFSELYSRTGRNDKDAIKLQKIACLLNYFKRITTNPLSYKETVTFSRVNHDERTYGKSDLLTWTKLTDILPDVEIDPRRKIEDTQNAVEVDFANKYLGGGVLGSGSVQEEIQFITRPEQLVGLLLCEAMTDKEAISIRGAKIYSGYSGYAGTFKFDAFSPFSRENTSYVCEREVVAIDAKDFSNTHYSTQFREEEIARELNKAYIGFAGDSKKSISTGNWGCGCFKGDAQLKFLLQWMAAARAGRRMIFHPFGETDISGFQKIVKIYRGQSVGKLLNDVLKCSPLVSNHSSSLFEVLLYGTGPKYPSFRYR